MAARRPPHGNRNRYALGCRCPDCSEAARLYFKRWRERRLPPGRVNSTGTARRLQALAAIGWPWRELARRLGTTDRWPSMLANQHTCTVNRGTADTVTALYQQLRYADGPSERARTLAGRRGWQPPAAWDGLDIDDPADPDQPDEQFVDEVAVARVLAGQARLATLTPAEQLEAYRRHIAAGGAPYAFAGRARTSGTTVARLRATLDNHPATGRAAA
jgi:hypothetical protein